MASLKNCNIAEEKIAGFEEIILKECEWKRMVKKRILPGLYPQDLQLILKGDFIMVSMNEITKEMMAELAFSKEEQEELARARTMPITFDEDCPETTPERGVKFRRVNPPRQSSRANQA